MINYRNIRTLKQSISATLKANIKLLCNKTLANDYNKLKFSCLKLPFKEFFAEDNDILPNHLRQFHSLEDHNIFSMKSTRNKKKKNSMPN